MELTKVQIEYIDNQLKKEGIKYWDVRIEMVDHIISDMEKNSKTTDFKLELNLSLKRIGWSGNLGAVHAESWKNVNNKYRKIYFQGFINFFKSAKNVILLLLFMLCYFFLSSILEYNTYINFSYLLFMLPMLCSFYLFYKSWKGKPGKSVHMDYGISYLIFSFMMLNAVIIFLKPENGLQPEYYKIFLLLVIPVHYVFMYSGYQVYNLAIDRVKEMKKELLSLQ